MQSAFKPVLVEQPLASLLTQIGHTAVLWSPEALDLSNKQVGVQRIEPRQFVILHDQTYLIRDESEALFVGGGEMRRGLVPYTKPAYACAVEIIIQHGARGAVILDSLADVSPAKVQLLEDKLAALGWFDVRQLIQLTAILEQVKHSDDLESAAIADLKEAVTTAIRFRLARMDDVIGEAQRAREGNMGRSIVTREDVAYFAEIGANIPETLTQPIPEAGVSPDSLAKAIAESNQAVVTVMSEAMEKAMGRITENVIAQLKGENHAQENTGTGKKETGKEVKKAA